jgi:hypothetical protein
MRAAARLEIFGLGDTATGTIGTVNLDGSSSPTGGMNVGNGPATPFKGTFAGRLVLTSDGRYRFATDQGGFQVLVVGHQQDRHRRG